MFMVSVCKPLKLWNDVDSSCVSYLWARIGEEGSRPTEIKTYEKEKKIIISKIDTSMDIKRVFLSLK